jgi:site-specific recombinase XerD
MASNLDSKFEAKSAPTTNSLEDQERSRDRSSRASGLKKRAPRYALNKTKYLIEPEVERLLHILESFASKEPRNCTLLWTLFHTGARALEVLNLT